MIRFICPTCHRSITIRDEFAGRTGKCACGAIVSIPERVAVDELPAHRDAGLTKTYNTAAMAMETAESEHGDDRMKKSEKRLLWGGIAGGLLVLGMVLLYLFVLRDTWEADHRFEIESLRTKAVNLARAKDWEASVRTHDELELLIGTRRLKDPELQKWRLEAEAAIAPGKLLMAEASTLRHITELEAKAKAFSSSGDAKRALESYGDALDHIQKTATGNPQFAKAIARITESKKQIEEQLAKAQAEEAERQGAERKRQEQEAYNRQMEANGYINHKGKWITKEEYAQAKATFPAKQLRDAIENDFPGNRGDFVVEGISIKKTDDLDFPYAIEITVSSKLRVVSPSTPDYGIYTFQCDADLNLSDNFSIRGGKRL